MIPSQVFATYELFADAMISDFGTNCLLKYPSVAVNTATNVPQFKTSKSLRPYDADPVPTLIHDDEQIKASEDNETVRMRVYWTPKDFVKMGGLAYPDASVQTIGYYSDIVKLKKAIEMWPDPDKGFCLVPVGVPIPWGLRKNRYCVAYWKHR